MEEGLTCRKKSGGGGGGRAKEEVSQPIQWRHESSPDSGKSNGAEKIGASLSVSCAFACAIFISEPMDSSLRDPLNLNWGRFFLGFLLGFGSNPRRFWLQAGGRALADVGFCLQRPLSVRVA